MFIRRTQIKANKTGEPYFTYRLVETERVGGKVKQRTLLNLGRYFSVDKPQWPDVVMRIEQLLSGQASLLDVVLSEEHEQVAQHISAQLLARQPDAVPAQLESVDLETLEFVQPRRVGVEQLAVYAMQQLELPEKLKALGFNQHQCAAALGNMVARMACPASERASRTWLQKTSGLGELLGYDYENMNPDRLYVSV